jgi:hypothetical protein
MSEFNKPNKVYRLRPVTILPGNYYKITRQKGSETTLEIVPMDNKSLARRLARLRYPELCEVMWVVIEELCETLGNEACVEDDIAQRKHVCVALSRAVVCLQRAHAQLAILATHTREEISPHEERRRPVANKLV